jgi:magnesium chelatase family protein
VIIAWERQQQRFAGTNISTNAEIQAKDINHYIILNEECSDILQRASEKLQLSLRAIHRLLKLSRSIADFADVDTIGKEHILEALQYR